MLYRELEKWDNPEKMPNLVYFSQLLEELLFDFSLDTYKPSAMNTSLLCIEALETIAEVENGTIKVYNLNHIINELCFCIENDIIAQNLISIQQGILFGTLKNDKTEIQAKKATLQVLAEQLSLKKYVGENKRLLINTIKSDTVDYKSVRSLTRPFVTSLLNSGFSSKYIHETCLYFFFHKNTANRIENVDAIEEFLALFDVEIEEYFVLIKADKVFETIKNACDAFKMEVFKGFPKEFADYNKPYQINKKQCYVIIKTNAYDIYSARDTAYSGIEFVSTLYSLFHHKHYPMWDEHCLIKKSNNHISKVKAQNSPMLNCQDLKPALASAKLNRFLESFRLADSSTHKFLRSAELHSLSLKNDSKENQLLNLWISLEALIPSSSINIDSCKIDKITKAIIPFLNLNYFNRLLNRLVKDLLYWNKPFVLDLFKDIEGKKFDRRLFEILALEDNKEKYEKLLDKTANYHLLKDRLMYFKRCLSSPKDIMKSFDIHSQRVEWQLRRIYRARNLIVHSANSPSYIGILIKNTHDYIDTILTTMMQLIENPYGFVTVEQCFKYIDLSHQSYYNLISKQKSTITTENVDEYYFSLKS